MNRDDLPRFLARFKELLNVNTINEIANFNAQLARERETIKERIAHINKSLGEIDYNPGRYIVLESQPSPDAEIRDFQQELRACTEGALSGAGEGDDEQYSEDRFLRVKGIIDRFRGREGLSDQDRRWTAKVTDVRNWFLFAASERWREDDSEHEHYSDSGGKSGGQKEKLAYTILAASLAYQFGLEWGAVRSRSFRFVVIDEAFGRGSDESAQYGLRLFEQLNLQLLIVTPLQKIHIIEPFVASVGFVHNEGGSASKLRNLSIEEYRAQKAEMRAAAPGRAARRRRRIRVMSWSTAPDLKAQVMRLWERGELLREGLDAATSRFPLRLSLKTPSPDDITRRFDAVRAWVVAISATPHVRLEWQETRHRVQGSQRLPASASVNHLDDALAWIGRRAEHARFRALHDETAARQPLLLPWLAKRPLRALELAAEWSRLLDVVAWLQAHPRPGGYLRQVNLPGIHTKFIESQRGVLAELLDLALPAAAIDPSRSGAQQFAARYGFLDKPVLLRLRVLDPALGLLPGAPCPTSPSTPTASPACDSTWHASSSPRTRPTSSPSPREQGHRDLRRRLRLGGTGTRRVAAALPDPLLGRHRHQRLRHPRPAARPLRPRRVPADGPRHPARTRGAVGSRSSPRPADVSRLTAEERSLYEDLRDHRICPSLRLEQEHMGFGWLEKWLKIVYDDG